MSEILVNTIKKADGTGSITVPADSGTVLTSGSSLSSFPSGFANGITDADFWKLTSAFTTSGTSREALDNYWSRCSHASFAYVGSGMTESAGVFSFPSTGIWDVSLDYSAYSTSDQQYIGCYIFVTTDGGSNFSAVAESLSSIKVITGGTYQKGIVRGLIDVTSTANVKIRFDVLTGSATAQMDGNSTQNRTTASFIRLGDT